MKFLFVSCCWLIQIMTSGQTLTSSQLYQKISNYYLQNPERLEYVESIHKNALGYDTSTSRLMYLHDNNGSGFIAGIGPDFLIMHGLLLSKNNYLLSLGSLEKIEVRKSELEGTIYSRLKYFPACNIKNLEKMFGTIKTYNKVKDIYQLLTSKYLLKVDTATYAIRSLQQYEMFEGKVQYYEYKFVSLPDSIENSLLKQAKELIEASEKFKITTFKEIENKRIPVTSFEGKTFAFNNLISFNNGPLNATMKGKYVIFDFFYQTCYPCHQMTKWILDWIPTIDTSKIVLIGIDPADNQKSMKLFVKDKGISYPIIIEKQALDIVKYYGISAYPTLILLSPDGKMQVIHEGMSKQFLTKAEKIVKRQSL